MPLAVPEVTIIDEPSIKYNAVVLSVTIKEASAGTDTVDTIGKSVPAPAAALSIETVVFTAFVPSTLAATIWLIL
jgi:hypothetical protein